MHRQFSFWNLVFFFGFGLAFSLETISFGEDWPTFRGPNRTSVVNDAKLLTSWPDQGPKLLWEGTGAGRGYASLAIVAGKIYTLGDGLSTQKDADEYLTCFDQATGKQLWATKTGTPWEDSRNSDWESSRGTPTVNEDRVYVVTPNGVLICCHAADGKEVWRKNFESDFGGKKADSWGYSESVLVDGNLLICTPGGGKSTVVALDKKTGETIWTCTNPDDRGAGHSSIVISQVGNTKVYVQSTGGGLMGFSEKGKLLWTYEIEKTTAVIPTPIIRGDLVFFPVGYKRGAALVKQVPSADGNVAVKEIYGLITKLSNKHGGVVLVGDYVYGDSDSDGMPYCAELMTGNIQWTAPRPASKGSAVVIASNDRLYIRHQDGTMVLAEANPAAYKVTGTFKIPGSGKPPSWSHPVIVDGKLYLREQDKILCYDIRS
ncbi:MAG: PQQ-binding-like beta-propeller repeat protein [Pirellulaceae bacterium]|nr:PQQ-binding-like beta-propeller repeat protein [Pirellulaceae bacterium]